MLLDEYVVGLLIDGEHPILHVLFPSSQQKPLNLNIWSIKTHVLMSAESHARRSGGGVPSASLRLIPLIASCTVEISSQPHTTSLDKINIPTPELCIIPATLVRLVSCASQHNDVGILQSKTSWWIGAHHRLDTGQSCPLAMARTSPVRTQKQFLVFVKDVIVSAVSSIT